MMKKYLICIITILLLFSCLGMTAFAETSAPTISDDYRTVYFNGETYSRVNASMIKVDHVNYNVELELTEKQQEDIAQVSITTNGSKSMINLVIEFKDGSRLSADYMQDTYQKTYEDLLADPNSPYTIDFKSPTNNKVTCSKSLLKANPVVLDKIALNRSNAFPILVNLDDFTHIYRGSLLISGERYYYVDYEEIGVTSWNYFFLSKYTELPAYEITDSDLLSKISAGEEAYYNSDFGFLYNGELTDTISKVFLILVFAIIPAVILVLFLILAIRTKTVYRKLFTVICCISGVELIIFAIVAAILH